MEKRNDATMATGFVHLHVHTKYSIFEAMATIPDLVEKCLRNGMNAMAVTDLHNMYGIKEFYDYVEKKNCELDEGIRFKPIIGCEVSVGSHHLILLAKNVNGYRNLCRMVSASWIEGGINCPHIERELLEQCHEGIIACSAGTDGEVACALLAGDYEKAKAVVLWYRQLFGRDYYLEMQRHTTDKPGGDRTLFERERIVNAGLLRLSTETSVKIICTNDVRFVDEEDAEAHDRLVCIGQKKRLVDTDRKRYTKQEWLKTPEEMASLFSDLPEALANTREIADKVEFYSLDGVPLNEKCWKDCIAHIVTFVSFGQKSSIREMARVMDLDDAVADRLVKMIPLTLPENPETHKSFRMNLRNCLLTLPDMKSAYERNSEIRELLDFALKLEGQVRRVGVHYCCVVVGADNLDSLVPLSVVRDDNDEDVVVTQYMADKVESVGLTRLDLRKLKSVSFFNG